VAAEAPQAAKRAYREWPGAAAQSVFEPDQGVAERWDEARAGQPEGGPGPAETWSAIEVAADHPESCPDAGQNRGGEAVDQPADVVPQEVMAAARLERGTPVEAPAGAALAPAFGASALADLTKPGPVWEVHWGRLEWGAQPGARDVGVLMNRVRGSRAEPAKQVPRSRL
jgi:hypothetical protein